MSFGLYRVEMLGWKKWTPLRPRRPMYYGDGYPITRSHAEANAKLDLADAKLRYPLRELRINHLEK